MNSLQVQFATGRVQATASGADTAKDFSLGTGSLQGIYRVCYCPSVGSCDDDADFTHEEGSLTVRGPVGGEAEAALLGSPAVLLYRLSSQQGKTVDTTAAVLEAQCAGVGACGCAGVFPSKEAVRS